MQQTGSDRMLLGRGVLPAVRQEGTEGVLIVHGGQAGEDDGAKLSDAGDTEVLATDPHGINGRGRIFSFGEPG